MLNRTRKAKIYKYLLHAALIIAAALLLEGLQLASQPVTAFLSDVTLEERERVFPDPSAEVIDFVCEDGIYLPQNGDPRMILSTAEKGSVRTVLFTFSQVLEEDLPIQIFYAQAGEGFSEQRSIKKTVFAGHTQAIMTLPAAQYQFLRIDINEPVAL